MGNMTWEELKKYGDFHHVVDAKEGIHLWKCLGKDYWVVYWECGCCVTVMDAPEERA